MESFLLPHPFMSLLEDGSREWYVEDKLHRLNGTAIIFADGSQEWYVSGRCVSGEVKQWLIEQNLPDWPDWTDKEKMMFRMWFS